MTRPLSGWTKRVRPLGIWGKNAQTRGGQAARERGESAWAKAGPTMRGKEVGNQVIKGRVIGGQPTYNRATRGRASSGPTIRGRA